MRRAGFDSQIGAAGASPVDKGATIHADGCQAVLALLFNRAIERVTVEPAYPGTATTGTDRCPARVLGTEERFRVHGLAEGHRGRLP